MFFLTSTTIQEAMHICYVRLATLTFFVFSGRLSRWATMHWDGANFGSSLIELGQRGLMASSISMHIRRHAL